MPSHRKTLVSQSHPLEATVCSRLRHGHQRRKHLYWSTLWANKIRMGLGNQFSGPPLLMLVLIIFCLLISLANGNKLPQLNSNSVMVQGGMKKAEEERIDAVAYKTSCHFPAIFNFGDSNSDTGGFSALLRELKLPNGETYFGKPAGRASDGRLIIDFIASSLKLPFLSAYLNSLGSNFSHGANFAVAASTILPPNGSFSHSGRSPISLDVQTLQFSQFKSRSSFLYHHEDKYFSNALYTFDIGQNDINAAFLKMTTEEVNAAIFNIIHHFKTAIQSVYNDGGRYFWIHNTGPLGCLALVLQKMRPSQADKYGCHAAFNDVAKIFNKNLKHEVDHFKRDFPLGSFVYVDIYSIKLSLFREGHKHGFEQLLVACCGKGGKYNFDIPCGTEDIANGTKVLNGGSCKKPTAAVNWDGIHYTEAANKYVFDRISGGRFSNPPLPIRLAYHA